MKITQEHYDYLKAGILTNKDNIVAHREFIVNQGKSKDVEKRLRWDLLYAGVGSRWVCDNLYPNGLNDNHIDTALKAIMKEILN